MEYWIDDDKNLHVERTNQGFSSFEVLGLITHAQLEI